MEHATAFCLTGLFFWRSLRFRPGPLKYAKDTPFGQCSEWWLNYWLTSKSKSQLNRVKNWSANQIKISKCQVI